MLTNSQIHGVPEYLTQSITLVLRLEVSVGAKTYSKILLMMGNFELRFSKFQEIDLPNSRVSYGVQYWIHIGNVFSYSIMIFFLLSFLGILSVWSNILQEEGNCNHKNILVKIYACFFLWYNSLLPVKYWTKPIKCLEMRAKNKSWWFMKIYLPLWFYFCSHF